MLDNRPRQSSRRQWQRLESFIRRTYLWKWKSIQVPFIQRRNLLQHLFIDSTFISALLNENSINLTLAQYYREPLFLTVWKTSGFELRAVGLTGPFNRKRRTPVRPEFGALHWICSWVCVDQLELYKYTSSCSLFYAVHFSVRDIFT